MSIVFPYAAIEAGVELIESLLTLNLLAFNEKFEVLNDPDEIIINFRESKVVDMSAIEAVNRLTERYKKAGKITTSSTFK